MRLDFLGQRRRCGDFVLVNQDMLADNDTIAVFQLLLVKDRFLACDALAYYLACFLAKLDRMDEANVIDALRDVRK